MSETPLAPTSQASVCAVFRTFLKLGLTSFGGPIAHLGYFYKELVEKQHWVSESQFGQLLAICQFLPGPASSQLGFVLGLLRAGWLGAIAAFIAFTLPSALLLIGFASLLPSLSSHIGETIIHGLKLVAFAVVADAVWNMFKKLCPDIVRRIIALASVLALLLIDAAWSQILVILCGAIAGAFFCYPSNTGIPNSIQVCYGKPLGFILLILFSTLLAILLLLPNQNGLQEIAQAFYNAGALVFGGGHVVLPLLQESIVTSGLVSNENFLAGYGVAQVIPGPMFTFSAYLGALIPSETQVSWSGAATALVFMFLPGFLLVTAALPMWQSISSNRTAIKTIAGINATVVGLLAAALYNPIFTSSIANTYDFAIGLSGWAILTLLRASPVLVIAWCVSLSLLLKII